MKSLWLTLLLPTLLSLATSILSIIVYDQIKARHSAKAVQIGMVDVGDIYRQKEAEFTKLVTRANVSDKDRERAIVMAQQFAQQLAATLEALPRECDCLVLPRSAVAGRHADVVDLTPHVKQKVGL